MWKTFFKQLWTSFLQWIDIRLGYISAAPRLFWYLQDIVRYGHHTVDTDFEYIKEDQSTETYRIRTFIEFDGDVINIIPDPLRYQNPNWRTTFEKAYTQHMQNVAFFFMKLEDSTAFWAFMLILPLFLGVNYRLVEDVWSWFMYGVFADRLKDQILDFGIFFASVFLLPQLVRLLMPRIVAFGLKQIERYLQKKEMI